MSKVDADVVEGASLQSHRQHLDFQLHLAVELLRLRHGKLQHTVTVTSNTSTIRNIPDPASLILFTQLLHDHGTSDTMPSI